MSEELDSFIYWLAQGAKRMREDAGRMRVHVGAEAGHSDSVIWKFEKGRWPRNPEAMIAAYARDLDVDELEIWELGLTLWREYRDSQRAADSALRAAQESKATPPQSA